MFLRCSPRPWWLLVAAAALLPGASILCAQTFDATSLRQPAYLGAVWLVHAGDDAAYAQPGFDDSQWTRFDPHGSLKSIFTHSRPPVVWYRLHIKVAPDQAASRWKNGPLPAPSRSKSTAAS